MCRAVFRPLALKSLAPHLHLPLAVFRAPAFPPSCHEELEVSRVLAFHVFDHSMREQVMQSLLDRLRFSLRIQRAACPTGNPRSRCLQPLRRRLHRARLSANLQPVRPSTFLLVSR